SCWAPLRTRAWRILGRNSSLQISGVPCPFLLSDALSSGLASIIAPRLNTCKHYFINVLSQPAVSSETRSVLLLVVGRLIVIGSLVCIAVALDGNRAQAIRKQIKLLPYPFCIRRAVPLRHHVTTP